MTGLFGGGGDSAPAQIDLNPGTVFKPFNIGGVSGAIDDGNINIGADASRTNLVNDLSGTLGGQANELRSFLPGIGNTFNDFIGTVNEDLLPKVAPGFGALSTATADAFANARDRLRGSREASTSNLRDDLARRNVAGSSFAQDTANRTNAEFDALDKELTAAEGTARSQAALDELNATTQLIEKAFQAEVTGITTQIGVLTEAFQLEAQAKSIPLDDLNNILEMGTGILNNSISQFGANARAEAGVAADAAAGAGAKAGQMGSLIGGGLGFALGGPVGGMIGSGIGGGLF